MQVPDGGDGHRAAVRRGEGKNEISPPIFAFFFCSAPLLARSHFPLSLASRKTSSISIKKQGCFYEHDSRELQLQQAALGTGEDDGDDDDFGEHEEGEGGGEEGHDGRRRRRQQQQQQQQADLDVLDESKLEGPFSAGDGSSATAAAA